MSCYAIVISAGGEVFARYAHMLGVKFDRVDLRRTGAICKPQRGIAQAGSELKDALRLYGSGQDAKRRAIGEWEGEAAMLRPMNISGGTNGNEWIEDLIGRLYG